MCSRVLNNVRYKLFPIGTRRKSVTPSLMGNSPVSSLCQVFKKKEEEEEEEGEERIWSKGHLWPVAVNQPISNYCHFSIAKEVREL